MRKFSKWLCSFSNVQSILRLFVLWVVSHTVAATLPRSLCWLLLCRHNKLVIQRFFAQHVSFFFFFFSFFPQEIFWTHTLCTKCFFSCKHLNCFWEKWVRGWGCGSRNGPLILSYFYFNLLFHSQSHVMTSPLHALLVRDAWLRLPSYALTSIVFFLPMALKMNVVGMISRGVYFFSKKLNRAPYGQICSFILWTLCCNSCD